MLDRAAREAGWGDPLPAGRARGVALHECFGSLVAQIAEVSIDEDGEPRVHRVVCVVDCGEVVHPPGVRHQMESGITFVSRPRCMARSRSKVAGSARATTTTTRSCGSIACPGSRRT
ncbi:MAG: molybdopterin cofactor-binding domain-containing protein [Myxococcota bacterium]